MGPEDPIDNSLSTPLKVPPFVTYLVILVGCLFAIFYTYKASSEHAPAPMEQAQPTAQASDQVTTAPSPKAEQAIAEAAPSAAPRKPAVSTSQSVTSPTPQAPQGAP